MLCYNIETEFAGNQVCSLDAPIICISILGSCGWCVVVTRHYISDCTLHQVCRSTNKDMSIEAIYQIISHRPSFAITHNVYGFDNRILALSSPRHTLVYVSGVDNNNRTLSQLCP